VLRLVRNGVFAALLKDRRQALATLSLPCLMSAVPRGVWMSGKFKGSFLMESLILAQNERWRRGLGMQVERIMVFGSWLVATW